MMMLQFIVALSWFKHCAESSFPSPWYIPILLMEKQRILIDENEEL